MQNNGENQMKLSGTKDHSSKHLDNYVPDKDFGFARTILVSIFNGMGYVLLLGILIIILPMLLPAIILVALQKPAVWLSTALENLRLLVLGWQRVLKLKKHLVSRTHIPLGYGIPRSRKECSVQSSHLS